MQVAVRRNLRGTLSALVNLALAWVTAFVVIGNQTIRDEVSVPWIVVGVLLIAWGGVIFSGLLRPVKLITDDEGVAVVRLFGRHYFRWEEINWVDFDQSERMALIVATVEGRDRYAAVMKRGVNAEELERAHEVIRARRPGLPVLAPTAAPKDAEQ